MNNNYIQVEYDSTEEILSYYENTEDSEQETINISIDEIASILDYKVRTVFDEKEVLLGYADGFDGDHFQDEVWELLYEWQPTEEELIKVIKYRINAKAN